MLNRYKIKLKKTWDFELDGKSKEDIEQQIFYIMNRTKILDLPEVKKRLRWKIIQVKERNIKDNEKNN